MARRISDVVEERVKTAIEALDVLQAVKDSIEWDISPALIPAGRGEMALAYMVAISVRVPGSVEEDYVLQMKPLLDPHAPQADVTALVAELHGLCQAAADEIRAKLNAASNGHRKSPGGLIIGGLSTP
jgi:hypothetical protein